MKFRALIVIVIIAFLGIGGGVFAQQEPDAAGGPIDAAASAPIARIPLTKTDSPLQCHDLYRKGSVAVRMDTELSQTIPGSILLFDGVIANGNKYPITNGALSAKVLKIVDGSAPEVIDQFVVKDNISLLAESEQEIRHEWAVPMGAEAGEYYLAYFLSSGPYSIVGNTTSNDTPSVSPVVSVISDVVNAKFVQSDTKINGVPYDFSKPFTLQGFEKAVITAVVTNPTDQEKTLNLQWSQFAWDAVDAANHKNTETEEIVLGAGERREVTYLTAFQQEPTTYVVASIRDGEARHVLDINLVQPQSDTVRLYFSSISGYPLKAGEERTLFTCVQLMNNYSIENITVQLSLTNPDGTVIHEYEYTGDIRSGIGGFGEVFTPSTDQNNLTLVAILKSDEYVIGSTTVTYNCANLNSTPCEEAEGEDVGSSSFLKNHWFIAGGAIGLFIVLLAALLFMRWKRKSRDDQSKDKFMVDGVEMTSPSE